MPAPNFLAQRRYSVLMVRLMDGPDGIEMNHLLRITQRLLHEYNFRPSVNIIYKYAVSSHHFRMML